MEMLRSTSWRCPGAGDAAAAAHARREAVGWALAGPLMHCMGRSLGRAGGIPQAPGLAGTRPQRALHPGLLRSGRSCLCEQIPPQIRGAVAKQRTGSLRVQLQHRYCLYFRAAASAVGLETALMPEPPPREPAAPRLPQPHGKAGDGGAGAGGSRGFLQARITEKQERFKPSSRNERRRPPGASETRCL